MKKNSAIGRLVKFNYTCFGISREAFLTGLMPCYFSNISLLSSFLHGKWSPMISMGILRFREQSPLWVNFSTWLQGKQRRLSAIQRYL
jgi:hypothetical protein